MWVCVSIVFMLYIVVCIVLVLLVKVCIGGSGDGGCMLVWWN